MVLSLVDRTGTPRDGFLSLEDICNLKLPVDLIVLSGCDTAIGTEVQGEGLIGLTRGFMYSGATRVVGSLWDVNDIATAEFMKRFYEAIELQKMGPAAALRAAQLHLLRDERSNSPHYWAAFQMYGEWR